MAKWRLKKSPTSNKQKDLPTSWRTRGWHVLKTVGGKLLAAYGLIVLMAQGLSFWINFSADMWPYITAASTSNQPSIFDAEFTLTNESRLKLYDAEAITQVLWGEMTNRNNLKSESGQTFVLDYYNMLGDIPGKKSAPVNIALWLRNQLKGVEQQWAPHTWKKFAFCFKIEFQILPPYLLPFAKQSQSIGYFFDKDAAIDTWRQHSCKQLIKILLLQQSKN